MMNPGYHFGQMRELLGEFEPSRERSLAQTKLDEAELWLTRCAPTAEALGRDLAASSPVAHPFADECDGFHHPGRDCNLPTSGDDEYRLTDAGRARADAEAQASPDVWTVAECLERIGALAGALHEIKTAYTPGTIAHDLAHATLDQGGPAPQPAPGLAAAMADLREAQDDSRKRGEVITEILGAFHPNGGGHAARVGQVQIRKWRERAGIAS